MSSPALPLPPTPSVTTPKIVEVLKPEVKTLERVLVDFVSAGAATLAIAPVICLIDRSVIENASGRSKSVLASVGTSLKTLFTSPHKFIFSKPFALIYLTYCGTYLSANTVDTISSIRNGTDIKTVTAGPEKFATTSIVNMSLGLVKDRSFARMFGTGSPRPVPAPTFVLFAARDALTIFSSFNVPPLLAPYMPQDMLMKPESWAQFLAPASCQIFSTPLHLLGLDLYNRGNVSWKERCKMIKTNYFPSAMARMCRILPAFGFGGVTNAAVRRSLLETLECR
ncbi:uncharacterized protein LAJ45_05492 [Morchella importuna]|uniref:uncharacterized protein n=1 Tax=Morchella importuna TaxID=1174673 RepID=UPI001E8CBDF4|nr:uncharacterized protein LAJ45_05492 [Morchella importuna]KAH8150281.1 hypothetical protein LAJ45_05492 [Morchella importuna]